MWLCDNMCFINCDICERVSAAHSNDKSDNLIWLYDSVDLSLSRRVSYLNVKIDTLSTVGTSNVSCENQCLANAAVRVIVKC